MRREASRFVALAILAVVTATMPRLAGGQELRGVVRDSASQLPIPGAVVTLQDIAATALARTTSNERGQFRALLLGDSVQRVRVVRLGFRPAVVRLPAAVDGVIRVEVIMASISMSLTPVLVHAGPSCSRRNDRERAMAVLEQARAGLLATVVAQSDKPAHMVRLRAIRTMDGFTDRVVHQRVRIDSAGTVSRSFSAARDAADLVRDGFTADSAGMTVYFGPDAEVLLDDRFATGYCFHMMQAERSRKDQIGLGFRPAKYREGRVDVDGALWIDTVARRLVDIEYRYVGTDPRAEAFRPGGSISFHEMPNGVVVIDRWSIRIVGGDLNGDDTVLPVIRQLTPLGKPVARRSAFYGVEVRGELARATWPDGFSWAGPLGTIHLRAVNADGNPVPGTVVRLTDTDYEATADSSGNLELPDLVPGPYQASIVDPELATLGVMVPTPLAFVAARRWTILTRLPVPDVPAYVTARCRGSEDASSVSRTELAGDAAWLVGRVVTPEGRPVPEAKWSLRQRDLVGSRQVVRDADVGSDGVFQYCRLRRGDNVVIDVHAKGKANTSVTVTLSKQPTAVTVVVRPR